MRRVMGWIAIALGAVLVAVSVVVLLIANDLARHGWASFRHAATVPVAVLAGGAVILAMGVASLLRR